MYSKIKLAFIITRLCAGGAATAINNLARAIDRNKFHITLLYGQLAEGEVDVSQQIVSSFDEAIELKLTRRSFSFFRDHFATQEIQKHLREKQFDIVHTHTSKAGFNGRLAAKREKTPLVIHSTHGIIFGDGSNIPGVSGWKKILFLLAEKMAARWCHRILTLSVKEIEQWQSLHVGEANQYRCLPSPVEVEKYERAREKRDQLREQWSVGVGQSIVVLLGRLAEEKGHLSAINAISEMENVELWIVGDGPLKKTIASTVSSKNLAGKVKLLGHRDDVYNWLALADVLLLNSSYEGQGLVLLEAMAAGVPVVASNVGGVSEIVENGKNGLLFEYDDENEIKKVINNILSDVDLRKKLVNAADEKYPNYSCVKIARALEDVYQFDRGTKAP